MNKPTQKGKPFAPVLFFIALAVLAFLVWKYADKWLRALLLYLSQADWAQESISHISIAHEFADRFIAGDTIAEAIAASRAMNEKGIATTINFLGEHVTTPQEAQAAREEIARLVDAIHVSGVQAYVSVKPSQLGLQVSPNLLYENMRALLARGRNRQVKIRLDMEDHTSTDTTLEIYRRLRDEDGFGHYVGVVIQAYLYRSEQDIRQLVEEGAWVRLCKGAYAEPAEIAFPQKADTDNNYIHLAQMMLSEPARQNGMFPAFATHDERMIEAIQTYAAANGIPPEAFEFQMLYGIRPSLQEKLAADGYQVRVYVPYGTAWYPYFVRRLAERPANLWFFTSNLVKEIR